MVIRQVVKGESNMVRASESFMYRKRAREVVYKRFGNGEICLSRKIVLRMISIGKV